MDQTCLPNLLATLQVTHENDEEKGKDEEKEEEGETRNGDVPTNGQFTAPSTDGKVEPQEMFPLNSAVVEFILSREGFGTLSSFVQRKPTVCIRKII